MKVYIGSKIKTCRLKSNISQKELCGDFLNRSILSKIETNKMLPSIPQLEYIADKLNVPIAYFFVEEDHSLFVEQASSPYIDKAHELFVKEDYYNIIKFAEFNKINKCNPILYYYLGMSFYNLNMSKDALKFLKKYTSSFTKARETIQKEQVISFAIASNTLFKIKLNSKDYGECKAYLLSAKKYLYLYEKTTSFINFIVISHLAFIYNELNNYEKTIELLEFFLNSNKTLLYMDIIPDIHISLNIAYYNIGDYEKSIDNIKKSIFFYSYIGNKNQEQICYLNYSNALRYGKKYAEAITLIDTRITACIDSSFLNRLIVQKSIVYFNLAEYNLCLDNLEAVNLSELASQTKANYFFMKGHIEFLNKNYNNALEYLTECDNYFISEHYYQDLVYLYSNLYTIKKDPIFLSKVIEYKNLKGRRNIF